MEKKKETRNAGKDKGQKGSELQVKAAGKSELSNSSLGSGSPETRSLHRSSSPVRVFLTSTNPVKIKATVSGVQRALNIARELVELKALNIQPPGRQPLGREETLEYAYQRIQLGRQLYPGYDYYIAIEGGIEKFKERAYVFAWTVVLQAKSNCCFTAEAGRFEVPLSLYEALEKDREKELGELIDQLSGEKNSKQKGGAISLFTGGIFTRKQMLEESVILAMSPFNEKSYWRYFRESCTKIEEA